MSTPRLSQPVLARRRDRATRALWVRRATQVLDRPMAVLGVLFVFVVLGQSVAHGRNVSLALGAAAWVLWAAFAVDLGLRWWVSPDRGAFLRQNWWQFVLLAVPLLRFVRVLSLSRAARSSRFLASALRSSRSARHVVATRIAWLGVTTSIVVLASSQLLYADGVYATYGEALHRAALATITGEPLARSQALAKALDVILAMYSVVVFATLAAAVGAYFLSQHSAGKPHGPRARDETAPSSERDRTSLRV